MNINFCFDNMSDNDQSIIWPNLVPINGAIVDNDLVQSSRASWSQCPPFVDYPRILDYLRDEKIKFTCFDCSNAPVGSLYLVNICWFDSDTDYFQLMNPESRRRLQNRELKFVMMYFEADSSLHLQTTIFKLCAKHNINPLDVHVILGNTMAGITPNFHYFDDDEIIFQRSQLSQARPLLTWHDRPRSKKITLLSRVHKNWRAFFCSWYWHHNMHLDSYFSYRMIDQGYDSSNESNPLYASVKTNATRLNVMNDFLSNAPFSADGLTDGDHNYYGTRVDAHYQDSYINCVLETHLSLHQDMPGVFITEKTWKPIAHAQPFVILGTAYSLKHLKSLGYRTFDEIGLDESYDSILDPTLRFHAVFNLISSIHNMSWKGLQSFNSSAKKIVEHNQMLYWSSKKPRLLKLFRELTSVD